MLNMDTRVKHYVKLVRTTLSNDAGSDYTLEGIISKALSNDISYSKKAIVINEEDIKTVDRDIYDIFEYETVEVNFNSYCWTGAIKECQKNSDGYTSDFTRYTNIYLTRNYYPEILTIYNTKRFGFTAYNFDYERSKSKKFKTFVILKDSLRYIPTDKYPECVLKNDYKLRMFNTMYAASLESDLKSIGLNKYSYSDLAELSDGGNAIKLSLKVEDLFRAELQKTLNNLKEEILKDMFNGKLKTVLNANKLSIDNVFNTIVSKLTEDCCGSLEFEIPTADIL